MKFVYAKQLKKKYSVWGHFYTLVYNDGKKIKCRNVLEICRRDKQKILMNINSPQAIFVMMNPGTSKALKLENENIDIKESDIIKNNKVPNSLVEAKPDRTQYQIMRLMKEKGWEHVRVINLSDCREEKSKKFYKKIENLKIHDEKCIHSIFSPIRREELDECFKGIEESVVVAWGKDEELDGLIQQALSSGKLNNRIGVNNNSNIYYYHASPHLKSDKLSWLEKILKLVNSKD